MSCYFEKQKRIKQSFMIGLLFLFALSLSCKKQENMTTNEVDEGSSIVEKQDIQRIEPPNWWIGFKNSTLQLLVHHPNISETTPVISYNGVSIEKVHQADSPNYLFIDLNISDTTKPGKFNISFKQENKEDLIYTYELKAREKSTKNYIGFDSSDAIYLITPDRFSNGNRDNDIVETLKGLLLQKLQSQGLH